MIKKLALFSLVAAMMLACTQVPVTGRRQLNLVPNSQIIPLADNEYKKTLKEAKLSTNATYNNMVKGVGKNIQKAVEQYMADKGLSSELEGFQWEFNVLEDDETVNAWCMPGGKVAFYTGIMPICKDESGVAVVMGHEVAHAIANHGRERMSQGLLANGLLGGLGAAMGEDPNLTAQIFQQAVGMGAQIGMLKFSRSHESEADRIGLIFMAMAGYDPREAPKFWERMAERSSGAPPEFLSTHPSHETRVEDLNSWMEESLKYYKK